MTGTELGYPSLAVRCGKKIRKVNSPPVPASYSHILPFTRCLRSVPSVGLLSTFASQPRTVHFPLITHSVPLSFRPPGPASPDERGKEWERIL